MDNRIDALYGRQSVDRKDSISIESQIEFCKFEARGDAYKEYTDKGYSGKNTDRPRFQDLIRDIEKGLIKRVIVYKLDRISRSIIDFANMMELFQRHNVEFVSSTEKFDTSTPMGRAMLNICIVFAQLERETIQKRVKRIADMSADAVTPERVNQLSGYLDNWDNVSFDDRRQVVDGLISVIRATSENVDVEWKI